MYFSEYLAILVIMVPWCCSWIGLFNCSSLLAAWMALSKIMRAGPQWGGFQDRSIVVLPKLMAKVCAIFRKRVLPSFFFFEASKGNDNSVYYFRSLLYFPNQKFNQRFPVPSSLFMLDRVWILEEEDCHPTCQSFS